MMKLIDGTGGAFLFTNNPGRLVEWYRESLGISYRELCEPKIWADRNKGQ